MLLLFLCTIHDLICIMSVAIVELGSQCLAHLLAVFEFLIEFALLLYEVSSLIHHSRLKGKLFLKDKCSDAAM